MTISAKVITDSVGHRSLRLTTFLLRYPRFIHAEVMTHRAFSRNASSSRAIPVERLIEDVIRDTAMPMHWGRNQPGMQAREEHDSLIYHGSVSPLDMVENRFDGVTPETAWLKARDRAIEVARAFAAAGYHKQVVNRLLEPFTHINVLVTATDYANFFSLRRHPDAQPEIRVLADAMWDAMQASTPTLLNRYQWHLPFVTDDEWKYQKSIENNMFADYALTVDDLIKVSVARSARTSYLTHDGKPTTLDKDLELYARLVDSEPLHASPAEHQATPDYQIRGTYDQEIWSNAHLAGNLGGGWIQYRKTLPGEHCKEYTE